MLILIGKVDFVSVCYINIDNLQWNNFISDVHEAFVCVHGRQCTVGVAHAAIESRYNLDGAITAGQVTHISLTTNSYRSSRVSRWVWNIS